MSEVYVQLGSPLATTREQIFLRFKNSDARVQLRSPLFQQRERIFVQQKERDPIIPDYGDDTGVFYFFKPLELTREHILDSNIPIVVDEWQEDTLYPNGALARVGDRVFLSVLTEAVSYMKDCPKLINSNIDPTDQPQPSVPIGECEYSNAGSFWWVEVDPETTYAEAMFNANIYNASRVDGPMSITIHPPGEYDIVSGFWVFGAVVELTTEAGVQTRDLRLFPDVISIQPPYGELVTHADRFVFFLDEPTTEPFTLTVSSRSVNKLLTLMSNLPMIFSGSAIGNLAVGKKDTLGIVNFTTEIGIIDYSRKERNVFGRPTVVPRWYQDLVKFVVNIPQKLLGSVKQVLVANRNTPCVFVGHKNPYRNELQVLGLLHEFSIPIQSVNRNILTFTVESVGVPQLVSGIPITPELPPPPLPEEEISDWFAVGIDEEPYITVIDSITWKIIKVNFTIPGPVYAIYIASNKEWMAIGHACPPYFTLVSVVNDWSAVPLPFELSSRVSSIAFSRDSKYLALGAQCDPYVYIMDAQTQELVPTPGIQIGPAPGIVALKSYSIRQVVFSPDSTQLLAATQCGDLYSIELGTFVSMLVEGHTARRLLYSPYGDYIVFGNNFGKFIWICPADDWTPINVNFTIPGSPNVFKFDVDQKWLIIGHNCPPFVTVVDVLTWTKIEVNFVVNDSICDLAFTPDGLYLAVVYRTHPYGTIIRTSNWTEFHVSYEEEEEVPVP